MSRKRNPSEFLKQIIGRPVVVKLNSGVDYRGEITLIHEEQQPFHALRYTGLSRWLHEYRPGADRRVRQWTGEKIFSS